MIWSKWGRFSRHTTTIPCYSSFYIQHSCWHHLGCKGLQYCKPGVHIVSLMVCPQLSWLVAHIFFFTSSKIQDLPGQVFTFMSLYNKLLGLPLQRIHIIWPEQLSETLVSLILSWWCIGHGHKTSIMWAWLPGYVSSRWSSMVSLWIVRLFL